MLFNFYIMYKKIFEINCLFFILKFFQAPAERISTEFHLPVGVQLLQVYIEQKQFIKLTQEANNERYYSSYLDSVTKKISQRKVSNI